MSSSENKLDYLPYFTEGKVVRGFGRGGAELGIPTANFPDEVIAQLPEEFVCGVYYGWACVNTLSHDVHKMVMCCGWNTHFNNTMKTMETHIMHKFDGDFYGENLRIIILGYIRPMEAYNSLDALIEAINNDTKHSDEALSQPAMMAYSRDAFLTQGKIVPPSSIITTPPTPQTTTTTSSNKNTTDETKTITENSSTSSINNDDVHIVNANVSIKSQSASSLSDKICMENCNDDNADDKASNKLVNGSGSSRIHAEDNNTDDDNNDDNGGNNQDRNNMRRNVNGVDCDSEHALVVTVAPKLLAQHSNGVLSKHELHQL